MCTSTTREWGRRGATMWHHWLKRRCNCWIFTRIHWGELYIVFDTCLDHTEKAGYFKKSQLLQKSQFCFLVVGHTKNAADQLFNSLKHKYCQQNIFTMGQLLERLNISAMVTADRTVHDDFFDYFKLFTDMYRDVFWIFKVNHIFSCSGIKPLAMTVDLRKSN